MILIDMHLYLQQTLKPSLITPYYKILISIFLVFLVFEQAKIDFINVSNVVLSHQLIFFLHKLK